MQQSLASFVVLRFIRFPNEAVNLLALDLKDGRPPQVWAQPDWRQKVNPEDLAYLSALIEEWKTIAPAEIPALFDELSRQSRGSLLVLRRGSAAQEERRALVDGYVRQ